MNGNGSIDFATLGAHNQAILAGLRLEALAGPVDEARRPKGGPRGGEWTSGDVAISSRERDSLTGYQNYAYLEVNQAVRADDVGSLKPRLKVLIKDLDRVLDVSRLSSPAVVYRGLGDVDPEIFDLKRGSTLTDLSFVSTTTELSVARDFDGLLFRIALPAGARAVRVSDITHANEKESEILLPRGSKFHVVKVSGNTVDLSLVSP